MLTLFKVTTKSKHFRWNRIGIQKIISIDEIQKIPELLNEVHRLIEEKSIRFSINRK